MREPFLENLSDEALDDREALLIRLLHAVRAGIIAEQLYAALCDVRLVMFERDRPPPVETAYGAAAEPGFEWRTS